jgi:glutathione S-transferase
MYKLYWSPGAASMAAHAALEEVGADYALERVRLDRPRDPAYLALNPTGRVPTLAVGDSLVVSETAAILTYLADRHPEAGLAPAPTDPQRPAFVQWTCYLTNTLQPAFSAWYHPERYIDDPAQFDAVRRKAGETLRGIWALLDRHLEQHGPYMLGDHFTTCDLMVQMFSEWREPHPDLLDRCHQVARLSRQVGERPSVRKMMSRQSEP